MNEPISNTPKSKGVGDLTYTERQELNKLSKEVFGASSRWQKIVEQGYERLLTEEVTELVPGEKEGDPETTRKVQVPLKRKDGAHQLVVERHNVDSIKEYMNQRKVQLDQIRAMIKKQQDEARAKKEQETLAAKVHEELQGSAL